MRKIGELKGKPIIEGNPNEIKKNQIHYKESDSGITLYERKEDNTFSSVTSGSGSGEGVKEYYYKWLTDDEEIRGSVGGSILFVNSIILKVYNGEYIKMNMYLTGKVEYPTTFIIYNDCPAFSIYGGTFNVLQSHENFIYIQYAEGNIIDKIKALGEGEEINTAIELINTYLKEITKEEYESMITYKPE